MTVHHKRWHLPVGVSVHLVGLVVSGLGLLYSFLYITEHGEGMMYYRGWPGKLKYLTFWNQMFQPAYFAVCVLNDLFGTNTTDTQHVVNRGRIQRLRDFMHAVLVYPMGMFVVVTFWAIYAVDRELVYPKALDKLIPVWQNHINHTSPLVFLLLEKMFVNITYPRKRYGLSATVFIAMLYQIWLLWIAHSQDIWVYPILRVLSLPRRCLFLASMWLVLTLLYMSGQWLSKHLWWGPPHHLKKLK